VVDGDVIVVLSGNVFVRLFLFFHFTPEYLRPFLLFVHGLTILKGMWLCTRCKKTPATITLHTLSLIQTATQKVVVVLRGKHQSHR
jgi:hypothetical protein